MIVFARSTTLLYLQCRPWTACRPSPSFAGQTVSDRQHRPSCQNRTFRRPRNRSCTRRYLMEVKPRAIGAALATLCTNSPTMSTLRGAIFPVGFCFLEPGGLGGGVYKYDWENRREAIETEERARGGREGEAERPGALVTYYLRRYMAKCLPRATKADEFWRDGGGASAVIISPDEGHSTLLGVC